MQQRIYIYIYYEWSSIDKIIGSRLCIMTQSQPEGNRIEIDPVHTPDV